MQDAHCTDSSGKPDCLWRVKCNITGASCPKMDALLTKLDTDKEPKMSNSAKNTAATPKTVAEQGKASNDVTDAVIDGASTEEVAEKVKKTIPAQASESKTEESKLAQSDEKLSLVQRVKAATEKLKKNKKALLILTGAAVVVGLTIKNNRKALAGEPLDEEDTTVIGVEQPANPDDTTDSV